MGARSCSPVSKKAARPMSRRLPPMVARGRGRLLFTSSIAATMPGPYESTYAASKAFLYSFAQAIRTELKGTGVTVTALMPGLTDTNFFARAGLEDTKLGRSKKDDPAAVARDGFEALMAGKDHVVAGSPRNKAQVAAAKVLRTQSQHRCTRQCPSPVPANADQPCGPARARWSSAGTAVTKSLTCHAAGCATRRDSGVGGPRLLIARRAPSPVT
jgi:NAD(P)-dependent dehydrogenase (short-subunit alcohol dehydrogenase family)